MSTDHVRIGRRSPRTVTFPVGNQRFLLAPDGLQAFARLCPRGKLCFNSALTKSFERANQQEEVAVITRRLLPAALGLWISVPGAGTLLGQEVQPMPSGPGLNSQTVEARPVSSNQQIAEEIAARLRQAGVLG